MRRRLTVELTRPRGSANFDLQKLHAKHALAARVQRFVRSQPVTRKFPSRGRSVSRGGLSESGTQMVAQL
jgi:hypothetical protein